MGASDPEGEAKRAFLERLDAKLVAAGHAVAPAAAPSPEGVASGPKPPAVAPPVMPPVLIGPAHLRDTNEAPDLPAAVMAAMGRLPFVPPAPAAPSKRSAKTLESKVVPSRGQGQTLQFDPALQRPTPNLPFAGTTGETSAVYVPALDARQYVALRAELVLRVAPRQETLRRYRVPNEAAFRALAEQWKHPSRWAELEAALGDFAGLLRVEVLR